ncbi:hypothetical protein Pst134EA_018977 [Puccinia striiformis f. sp. tritici]|uniref:hypothetical protein n=1 Tax=Puccinia striiformis f. sp. tritici TaxID=168172 RepID=UPI0020078251|nr:hypothetical protein Pst134EA_018977 [Puccinia striiformis f. sp. tritici]KAH9458821.1 hypothetical protein Pst134EA_018977 [Puccinia striiformis f. sp. tritici]
MIWLITPDCALVSSAVLDLRLPKIQSRSIVSESFLSFELVRCGSPLLNTNYLSSSLSQSDPEELFCRQRLQRNNNVIVLHICQFPIPPGLKVFLRGICTRKRRLVKPKSYKAI